jgi:hypothetical protein
MCLAMILVDCDQHSKQHKVGEEVCHALQWLKLWQATSPKSAILGLHLAFSSERQGRYVNVYVYKSVVPSRAWQRQLHGDCFHNALDLFFKKSTHDIKKFVC